MSIPFSIVILTKDRPKLLRRAVRSALLNLTKSGELIVIDDHSANPASDSLSDFADDRLRVVRLPLGKAGVAAARNAGLAHACGDIIFYLDDDDMLEAGYCNYVLSNALDHCDYGFAAYYQVNMDGEIKPRVRFKDGPIPDGAPLHKKICGFGMGFWIKSRIANEVGLVSTDLSINEDTDYVCRLITAGKRAWYTAKPSVSVYAAHDIATDVTNMTKTTTPIERARCMRIVCDRFPNMIGHLGASYIRHCAKNGAVAEAYGFIQEQSGWRIRSQLAWLLIIKLAVYRVTHRPQLKLT